MTIIEVLRPPHRWYGASTWRRWTGSPPADASTNEHRAALLRHVWPRWQFRVVMLLEKVDP